jgi:hypothetical protein
MTDANDMAYHWFDEAIRAMECKRDDNPRFWCRITGASDIKDAARILRERVDWLESQII